MKKLFVALMLMPLMALADTEVVDGITWTYTVTDGKAEIRSSSSFTPAIPSATTGAITIPSTLGGCPVVTIGDAAFYSCSGLTSVTIPSSVTSIGERVFLGCSGLTTVTIPEGVTSIGFVAFSGCSGLGEGVVIVDGCVLTVNGNCPSRVVLPEGVRLVAGGAFRNEGTLANVTLPSSVTSIGDYAFSGCSGLMSVTLPSGVTSIGDSAFSGCSGLTSVTISEGVASIGDHAFSGCRGLTSVTILSSATRIGEGAFRGCDRLADCDGYVVVGNVLFDYIGTDVELELPQGIVEISGRAFYGNERILSIIIPDGTKIIGSYAFGYCKRLASVEMPSGMSNIGESAFYECEQLASIVIPDGVETVGSYAFGYCEKLTSVIMPSSVTNIGYYPFYGCDKIDSVRIPACVNRMSQVFESAYSDISKIQLCDNVSNISDREFEGCRGIGSITIPNGVTNIGARAFADCVSLWSIQIPKSVQHIGLDAFSGCYNLGYGMVVVDNCMLCLNKDVKGEYPFEVKIPSGVRLIAGGALGGGVSKISIPATVNEIGEGAFARCYALNTISVDAGNERYWSDGVALYDRRDRELLRCMIRAEDVVVAEDVTSIGYGAFMNCDIRTVVLPTCLTNIADRAFYWCSALSSVKLPDTLRRIGKEAFVMCDHLKEIILPLGIEVTSDAFPSGCHCIKNVLIHIIGLNETIKYDGLFHDAYVLSCGEQDAVKGVFCSNDCLNVKDANKYVCQIDSTWFANSNTDYIVQFAVDSKVDFCIVPRYVSLVSGSAVKNVFDGNPLTCDDLSVEADGFVGDDGVTWTCTGSQTEVGSSENTFEYEFKEGTLASNYNIIKQYGMLTVFPAKVASVGSEPGSGTAPSGGISKFDGEEVKYDGEGHTINVAALESVTLVADTPSFSYSLTSNGVYRSEPYYFTNACVASMWYKISAPNYEDYVHEARVTILPRPVTLTSGSASKNFDGTALRCERAEVTGDGFVGADGVNAVYSGAQLWLGTSKNTFDYSFRPGTIGSNYQITKAFGDLAVTATGAVTVDDSITKIPEEAFKDCTDLTAVVLPEGVTEIGANAFAGCTKLKRITFPANMEIRREWLYEWGLTDEFIAGYRVGDFIVINTTVLEYVGDRMVTTLTIPSGTTVIDDESLAGLDNLASVTFAGTERVLGARVFKDGVSLEAVELPECLEEIGEGAFENCTWMSRAGVDGGAAFPASLRRVGARAFYNCMELTSVVWPEGVVDVGDNAFYNCRGLISASLPHSLANIGANAFARCAKLTGVTAPTGLKTLAEIFPDAFDKVTSVTVPDGETEIMEAMFRGCESVTRFTIPLSVTNVGQSAFEKCSALPSLALPDDIVEIGSAAFKDCSALSVISLPKNVQALADETFVGCGALESVIVPASVARLGRLVFGGSAVTEVKYLGNAPDYESLTYEDVSSQLTSYMIRGSTGWDYAETGIRTSRQKPDAWIGRAIEYWSPNIFEVTFDGNGGTPATYVAEQITDTTYSLPKVNPTRDGYVFKGWWTEPVAGGEVTANTICVANRDHSLYAHWEAGVTVEVSFNPCGGTVVPDVRGYVSGTTYGEFPVPTKRGYKFLGWFTAAERGERVREADRVPPVATTLYAQWKPIVYAVEFHANNGTEKTASQTITFGELAALWANTFTWGDHNFIGWARSPGGAVEFADKDVVLNLSELDAEDGGVVCLYARWSGASYAVRFDGNGGSGHMDNETFMVGLSQAIDSNRYERVGCDFAGWARTPTGDVAYRDGDVIRDIVDSGTVVLYAVWVTHGAQRLTVHFDAGEGATPELQFKEYEIGQKYGALPGATRTGYAMVGWFTAQTGGVLAGATSNVTAHTTLYAHWTPITYRVSFDGNGGEGNMSHQTFTYDQERALERCTFVRGGYDFVGWSNLAAGDVIYVDGQRVENLTATPNLTVPLYAVWKKTSGDPVVPPVDPPEDPEHPEEPTVKPVVTNTIAYVDLQGAVNTNVTTFTTNDLPLVLGPVEREGWRFLGWTPNGGVIPAGTATNVTFAAMWEEIVEPPPVEPPEEQEVNPWCEDADFSATVANTYDGYMIDEDYNLLGVVQVKTTKQAVKKTTDRVTKAVTVTTNITATATVTDANGKKWSYSKGVATAAGVVTGLKCTTKGCPVAEFGVKVGANGMDGAWGEYAIFGARNGMGTKGDEMMTDLEDYKGKWSVTIAAARPAVAPYQAGESSALRLQLNVQAKGVVKIAGNWESGAKVSASAQLVMGDGFVYVPVMVKSTKTSPAVNALLRIDGVDGDVHAVRTMTLVSGGELIAGGQTVEELGEPVYLPSEVSKGGAAFLARVAVNELAYPAKFAAKKLPTGLKIDAATGVISGTPTKPGHYVAEVTVTGGLNSKVKETLTVEFDIANYTDGLIPIKDAYGPYYVGVAAEEQIDAAAGCTVSGLPSGLKWTAKDILDSKTKQVKTAANTIYGIPIKACTNTVYFKKSVKEMVNGKQKTVTHQASATFVVEGMRPWAIGTFNGPSYAMATEGRGGENGLVQLTIAKTGKISGKWMSEGLTWTLSAASFDAFDAERAAYHATVIGKSGKLVMTNEIEVTESGVVAYGARGEDAASTMWEAWRNGWKEEPWKTRAKNLKGKKVPVGEVLLTVGSSGAVTAKRTFGSYSATCSTVLIPQDEEGTSYAVYLYFPPKSGKFEGFSTCVELKLD